jgi:reverse gyrase
MSLPERIAAVLAPHLGEQSADATARHVCAKYGLDDNASAGQIEQVVEFLRRGLVVYVGADKAKDVAAECARLAASEGA